GRAAHLAQQQDFHMKVAAVVDHAQHVAGVDLACRLSGLPVGLNPAQLTSTLGQGTRLEEAGGPKPLVDTHGGHEGYSPTRNICPASVGDGFWEKKGRHRDIFPFLADEARPISRASYCLLD